ncbi:hypothetical protein CEXT_238131 [Caerostris extrusa]|uniref:Uncharacterized protein n=1 Tax=Caerostris extrusa TaxID=172846 RepID=A0AAV4RHH5_CAEEX|nr:hypothetical protein CEXT_238131 [Caerostris extrusa]
MTGAKSQSNFSLNSKDDKKKASLTHPLRNRFIWNSLAPEYPIPQSLNQASTLKHFLRHSHVLESLIGFHGRRQA